MTLHQLIGIGRELQTEAAEEFDQVLAVLKDPRHQAGDHGGAGPVYKRAQALLQLAIANGETLLSRPEKLLALHELTSVHDGALVSVLAIHYNLCMGTIRALGNDSAYVQQLYQLLQSGQALGVYLATETAYGNNVASMETEAEYDPVRGEFSLRSPHAGAYKFMPNTQLGPLSKVAVVMARLKVAGTDYGVTPFLLPIHENNARRLGIRVSPLGSKPGFDLDNAITSFHDVRLPYEALLGGDLLSMNRDGVVTLRECDPRKRFLMAMSCVQTGKLCMVAMSLSMGKAALHITARYGKKRKTFSDHGPVPVISYHGFADRLATDTASMVVLSIWHNDLVQTLDCESLQLASKLPEDFNNELALAKAQISWRVREVLVACREMCGAQGLFSYNKIADYHTVNNGVITAEGDNLVVALKAGRDYLKNAPPIAAETDDPAITSLRKPLQRYFETLLTGTQAALRQCAPDTRFSTWNQHSEDVLNMVNLYGVLRCTRDLSSLSLDPCEHALAKLCTELYLLEWLEKLSAQLVSEGFLDRAMITAARLRKRHIVHEHRSDLLSLIDLFNVDACQLDTPITSDDYVEWYKEYHWANQMEIKTSRFSIV
jgi:acyl-CoA oxidase